LLALEGDHVSSFHLFVTKINLVSLCQNIYLQSSFHRMLCMNPTPSIVQFGKILTSLIKMKNYPTAIVTATSVTSIFPFNIMINCYCHVGHIILAKNFKLGFHPDTVTFSTLIEDLCLKGHIHKALHFHDQLIAQGFHLNQVSYGILINGLCKLGETRAAM
jgi:pentatricopeptide repeat domain-containing protein 1/leucine-rich PPR motif-containing protein